MRGHWKWSYVTHVTTEHMDRLLAGRREMAKGLLVFKEVGNIRALADHIVG